ncbi:GAF domain-containing protein [Pseudomonas oryzihabitans]|uniref:GAF domain-containing protein n=1 Tax=Pseudomonas oryzihabitans TaxID=47885 RepID=A0A1G5P6I7_9PSED|nr:GAF domain-containing protein [Pseudomonas psychrotolerans]
MALESPSKTQPDALADCANEPIHIPGSIQEHGFLFAVEEPDLRIVQASANVREYLGVAVEEVLGRTLGELLPERDLPAMLGALTQEEQNPIYQGDVTLGPRQQTFALFMHRFGGVLIVEFEAPVDSRLGLNTLYPMVRVFIEQLHQAETVDAIAKLAVREAKRISGFDHTMIYRFDEDGHGQVLAEECDPGVPSYLGLRFPASDIPAQARRLYLANRIRVIGNAYYQPSPLQPQTNPLTGQPLDLSFAQLRSVSPVHLQYMRNMGTLASMSISIVVGDRLWGLVLCHDRQPQRVSFQTRTACELFGRVLSLQIDAAETHAESDRRLALRQSMVQMLSTMADRDSVCQGLLELPQVFLDFARAQGAAIISSDGTELIGQVPPREVVDSLVEWLSVNVKDHFVTDNLAKDIAELPQLAQHAAGVLAVPISELHSHYLIWFRSELVQVVNWAGRPTKQEGSDGRLSPRQSFVLWQETVRGLSLPWSPLELESAIELRNAVRGIVLRKAEEMAELAEELQRSNKELAAFFLQRVPRPAGAAAPHCRLCRAAGRHRGRQAVGPGAALPGEHRFVGTLRRQPGGQPAELLADGASRDPLFRRQSHRPGGSHPRRDGAGLCRAAGGVAHRPPACRHRRCRLRPSRLAQSAGQCHQIQSLRRAGGDRDRHLAERFRGHHLCPGQRRRFQHGLCGQAVWRLPAPAPCR